MLPKKNRLPLRQRRDLTQQQATTYSSPLFTLLVAQPVDRTDKPPRFATLLSKKVARLAVDRNKKRRQILNAAHQLLPHTSPGADLIIIPLPAICQADFHQIKDQLKSTLKQASIFHG